MADVMQEFYDGPHATPAPASEGPVYLGIKNMTEDGHLDLAEIRHIAESDYKTWTRRVEPRRGDVVFTYEASLHRYAIIPEGFRGTLGRRVALLRPRGDTVDTRFLLYLFISPAWRRTVQRRINVGSTVDRLPLTDFPKFPLRLPPLATQRKIASILSAYDDLIGNNDRRIKILEEMAQRIYHEWFVEFGYPGHESVPLIDSELGPIPETWSVRRMDEVADVIDCLHSKKPDATDLGAGILLQLFNIASGGMVDLSQSYLISALDYEQWTSRIELCSGDCVVTNVGRIAAVAQIPRGLVAAPGRNMTAIRPRAIPPTYLLQYLLSEHMDHEVQRKKDAGSIMDALNVKGIVKLAVPVPDDALAARFEHLARPIRSDMELLVATQQNLRATRDLLLPRLVSGEIDVTDLDIELPDLVA
jgi:type I restriction enzyme S subunit